MIGTKPYGCNNSDRKPGYYAPQRVYHADGGFVPVANWIEDKSTLDCQYRRQIMDDPRCNGCVK